jgi:hypothetical protein
MIQQFRLRRDQVYRSQQGMSLERHGLKTQAIDVEDR